MGSLLRLVTGAPVVGGPESSKRCYIANLSWVEVFGHRGPSIVLLS